MKYVITHKQKVPKIANNKSKVALFDYYEYQTWDLSWGPTPYYWQDAGDRGFVTNKGSFGNSLSGFGGDQFGTSSYTAEIDDLYRVSLTGINSFGPNTESTNITNDITTFFVFKSQTDTIRFYYYSLQSNNINRVTQILINNSTVTAQCDYTANRNAGPVVWNSAKISATYSSGQYCIAMIKGNMDTTPSGMSGRIYPENEASKTMSSVTTDTPQVIVGSDNSSSWALEWYASSASHSIAEIIIYNTSITTLEVSDVISYLQTKWSI